VNRHVENKFNESKKSGDKNRDELMNKIKDNIDDVKTMNSKIQDINLKFDKLINDQTDTIVT